MLQYLLLTAAVALGEPASVPATDTPAPLSRGTLSFQPDEAPTISSGGYPPAWAPPAPAPNSGAYPPAWVPRQPQAANPPAPPAAHPGVYPAAYPVAQQPAPAQAQQPAAQAQQPAPKGQAPAKPPEPLTLQVISQPPAPPPPPPAAPAAPPTYPTRYALMEVLQGTWPGAALDGSRTYITGWNELSYTLGTAGHVGLPETLNYRDNEPVMQQMWVKIARPVVNGTTTNGTSYAWPNAPTEPTFGFESDWIIGTDYRFTLPPKGLFNDQLTDRKEFTPLGGGSDVLTPNIYGVDPVQFYAEAYFPTIGRGLDVKVGRFYTPYGVESLEAATQDLSTPTAVSTPLISHDYIFSSGSPFTHTGVLATLTLTPVWTVQAGAVIGNDVFFHESDRAEGIFTIQWTQPQGTQAVSRNVVKFTTIDGPARFDDSFGISSNFNIYDIVWTHYFNPNLASNVEALYGFEHNVRGQSLSDGTTINPGFVDWGGVAGYLTYVFTPRFSGCVRVELFDDPQGVRTSTAEDPFLDRTKGLYSEATIAGVWRVKKWLYLLPELRYDYNYDSAPFGVTIDHPTNGHHGQATAAGAMIVRW